MRARRIGAIIGVVAVVALCFGLGFCSSVIVQHSRSLKKEPKPIDPPAELSDVGKKVWKLESGLLIAEEFEWLFHGGCMDPMTELPEYAYIAFSTELAMDRLRVFFSGEAEQYADDPEYWYERWLFWEFISSLAGPAKPEEEEAEREAEFARDKMSSFAKSYAPIAYRLSLGLDRDSDEFAQRIGDLRKLQPQNGFTSLLAATAAAERGELEETLSLIDEAITAEDFRLPVAPMTEVIYDHWVIRKETVPSALVCRYISSEPAFLGFVAIKKAYRFVMEKTSDDEFMAALPKLKRLTLRIACIKPGTGSIQSLMASVLIKLLNRRAAEAYTNAGNREGIEACLKVETMCIMLQNAGHDLSGHPEKLEEMIKRHSGKTWRDLVGFSDYIKLWKFGDIERVEHKLTDYEELEYPPLEPQPDDEDEAGDND